MDSQLEYFQTFFSSYDEQIRKMKEFEQLYRILLSKYHLCVSCVYRIFSVMAPRFYSDDDKSEKLMNEILGIAESKLMNHKDEQIKQRYGFMLGAFKVYVERYNKKLIEEQCWLCSGILQEKFIQKCAGISIRKIKEQGYGHKEKYKLNVKMDNMLTIKFQIFCNLILSEFLKEKIFEPSYIQLIKEKFISPLFDKTGLDLKTVFKWKLSHYINQLPPQEFILTSTIKEDEQTVIVSLEIQHNLKHMQKVMTNMLGPMMHLEVTRSKKGRIDLEPLTYQCHWTQGIINRINQVNEKQWRDMLQSHKILDLKNIQQQRDQEIQIKVHLQSENIFFCGRYVKFSRYLSQTPWIVNKERLTQSSLQQEVQKKILKFFYPNTPAHRIDIKFHAGGREDIDVRMLKGGRPFVLEFVNPRICLKDITIPFLYEKISSQYPEESKKLPPLQPSYQQEEIIKCNLLQFYINNSTELAKVNGFRKTNSSYISKQLKQAEIQKIKHYVCYIKTDEIFTKQDKDILDNCYNLKLIQKTPVRVLHRRTSMFRDKMIHKMIFHPATTKSGVLQIWGSAGTYIKQFVHGDLNRTTPNVGSLLGKPVDILQLDVGSLKEGEWAKDDHEAMRLGSLQWQYQNFCQ